MTDFYKMFTVPVFRDLYAIHARTHTLIWRLRLLFLH